MKWQGVAYRAHDPRWSFEPTSGEGAAIHGGRFNPKGVPALYLALTVEGMLLEMGHGFSHRFDPLTICSYAIDMDDLVDLRSEAARKAAGVATAEVAAPWAYDLAAGREPTSWTLARRHIARGASGFLVPSFARGARPGAANLVLWRWGPNLPHKVTVHDPQERLPKDQTSWPNK